MKSMILLTLLMFSSFSFASGICDLRANDLAVDALNEIFDRGEMRGEDHVIGLKQLYTARMGLIEACVANDQTYGITKQELIDTLDEMDYNLRVYVAEMNESIRIAVENDRIGMATAMTMERDMEVVDKKVLMAKIQKLLK